MVNRKETIKMNMIGGYIDRSVSGQVSLHINLDENHELKNYESLPMDRPVYVDKYVSEHQVGLRC